MVLNYGQTDEHKWRVLDMAKTGYSVRTLFDGFVHYDHNGEKTGYSVKAPGGGFFHYDEEV